MKKRYICSLQILLVSDEVEVFAESTEDAEEIVLNAYNHSSLEDIPGNFEEAEVINIEASEKELLNFSKSDFQKTIAEETEEFYANN